MTAISLGMPEAPPPVLAPRRKTRQIQVGKVGVGSDHPISVQSMTTTLTSDVNATLQQIAELTATGCDIVRVACPSQDDADALPEIAQHSQIPVIADIHFQPKYVFAAIDAGCAAVRVNPGNIRKFDDQVKEIARAAKDRGTSIRIGVNAGSLDKRIIDKYGKATPEALVESAVWEAGLFEEHDFHDFKISVKHNDPVVMVRAYELLAEAGDWPLHLGVTEAGPAFQGTIKSSVAFGALLSKGIGDTIRVSLSAPPVEEVKVGLQILESLNLKPRRLEIVSCPSCGRAQVDVYKLAEEVTAGLDGLEVPLRVAVMGCVVNGPGEAREADLGVASGNGKGQIFVKGEVIKTVPESQIVETLIEEAMRIAEEMEPVEGAGASVTRLLTRAGHDEGDRARPRRYGHRGRRAPGQAGCRGRRGRAVRARPRPGFEPRRVADHPAGVLRAPGVRAPAAARLRALGGPRARRPRDLPAHRRAVRGPSPTRVRCRDRWPAHGSTRYRTRYSMRRRSGAGSRRSRPRTTRSASTRSAAGSSAPSARCSSTGAVRRRPAPSGGPEGGPSRGRPTRTGCGCGRRAARSRPTGSSSPRGRGRRPCWRTSTCPSSSPGRPCSGSGRSSRRRTPSAPSQCSCGSVRV